MNWESFGTAWVGVVVLCCLAVGAAGGVPSEGVRPLAIEAKPELEFEGRSEGNAQLQQRANATGAENDIRIDVRADGSATWTVQYRTRLDDATEAAAFEQLSADIDANPEPYRERFTGRLNETVASAAVATGREMAIEDIGVRATQRDEVGIVTYTFVWQNFAATDDDRVQVGDALTGFFLDDGTRLTVRWPDGYDATTIRPEPDGQSARMVRWTAPTTFDETEPFVEMAASSDDAGGDGPRAEDGPEGGSGNGWSLLGGAATVVVLVSVVGWWMAHRRTEAGSSVASTDDTNTDGPGAGSKGDVGAVTPAETAEPVEATEPSATEATGTKSSLELLSNEERVLHVLDRLGGRAKQQQVIEELGWTETKTSLVISDLRNEGAIEGFRLGRENVLLLPEEGEKGEGETTE